MTKRFITIELKTGDGLFKSFLLSIHFLGKILRTHPNRNRRPARSVIDYFHTLFFEPNVIQTVVLPELPECLNSGIGNLQNPGHNSPTQAINLNLP